MHASIPRNPAVEPCLDLVNSTWHDHLGSPKVYDRLPDPMFRRWFLKRWGYRVPDPDAPAARRRLVRLRALLRAVMEAYIRGRVPVPLARGLEAEINRPRVKLTFRLAVERVGDPWDIVISDIATSAARIIAERRPVKVCANPACTWMFVDETRPGTRRWCDVTACGNLLHARRHRRRRRR